MKKLIVGLGNPGPKYHHTRHNVGFGVVAELGRRHAIKGASRGPAIVGEGTIGGQQVVLGEPTTMMNLSGKAVAQLLRRANVFDLSNLLIVYDELDLPLGTVRIRPRGSAGGHNGVKSIIQAVGGPEFSRLRVGIGRPPAGTDPIEYVLGRFTPDERPLMDDAISVAADAIECWLQHGTDETMNQFNGSGGGGTGGGGGGKTGSTGGEG